MNKLNKWVIGVYISLYIVISFVSTMHSVSFFDTTNNSWMAYCLAGAFELGQLAAMAGLMTLEKSNKKLILGLMVTLTAMQIMANMFYSYSHVHDADAWFELFGLNNTDPIVAKRILAAVSGGLLPLIALGFIKSLVDYLKPADSVAAQETTVVVAPVHESIVPLAVESLTFLKDVVTKKVHVDAATEEVVLNQVPVQVVATPVELTHNVVISTPLKKQAEVPYGRLPDNGGYGTH